MYWSRARRNSSWREGPRTALAGRSPLVCLAARTHSKAIADMARSSCLNVTDRMRLWRIRVSKPGQKVTKNAEKIYASDMLERRVAFGPFVLDREVGTLLQGDVPVPIG